MTDRRFARSGPEPDQPVSRDRRAIAAELSRRDPVMAGLIAAHGLPPARRPLPAAERFGALVRSICSQQLAGSAARAIHGRLVASLGGAVTPERMLALAPEALAATGLSRAKVVAVRDLAERVASGAIALERIGRLSDAEVVEHLVQARGVGRWTAEMFLLFTLGRPDVWPVGDLGVRTGFAAAWGLASVPTPRQLEDMGERYRPLRSTVAWYCWRVVDRRVPKSLPAPSGAAQTALAPRRAGRTAQRMSSRTAPVASTAPEVK